MAPVGRWAAGALLALGACAGGDGPPPVPSSSPDTPRLVVSGAPAWDGASPWIVADAPSLDLTRTGSGPEHEFFLVRAALTLSGGGIVVADGPHRVRAYGPDGRLVWSAGGEGDGPGEFRNIRSLSRTGGDSLAVYDVLHNRLTLLAPTGEVGRTIPLADRFAQARHLVAYGDSNFLGLTHSYAGPPEPGRYRASYALVLLGPDGTVLDTLATVGGFEGFRGALDAPLPFGKDGHLAVGAADFVVGDADSLAFRRYAGPGAMVQEVAVAGLDMRLSTHEVDSTRQALRPSDGRPHPQDVLDFAETIPIPASRPGYARLLLDAEGYVWAAPWYRRMNAAHAVAWQVFSPDGVWLGAVETPPGFTAIEIGTDHVLGVRLDGLDVEHVQVLPLDRGR